MWLSENNKAHYSPCSFPCSAVLLVVPLVFSVREQGLCSHSVVASGQGCVHSLSLSYFGVLDRRWGFLHALPFSCGLGRQKSLRETAPLKHYHLTSSLHFFSSPAGLWYYLQGQDRPCLTLIGSPNFGYRSVHRDLEAQIAIITENEELQSQLQEVGSFFL